MAGHTRVIWVSQTPQQENTGTISTLTDCLATVTDIAMSGDQRRIGKDHWESVFCNPHNTDEVRTVLEKHGFTVHDVSIEGTPYDKRAQ